MGTVPSGRRTRPAHSRLWPFALASAPYGSLNGLIALGLPYVLRIHGISVGRISTISAVVQAPAIWYFLWAPVVDVGLRRRAWVMLLAAASAMFAAVAFAGAETASTRLLTVALVAASVFVQPISSAIGGLAASVVPNDARGRAGGWSQAGTLAGGVLAGGLAVWLTGRGTPWTNALLIAAMIGLPSLAVLAVREPAPAKSPVREHLASMLRDVLVTLRRRRTWLGLLYFVSPIGAGALMNLFSAVAGEYHASKAVLLGVVAMAGVLTPIGALLGGAACDRFDRWLVYPTAGLVAATSAGLTALMPRVPATYLVGAAAYALATGFCYSAAMALALELVGLRSAASSTRFTLFTAAVNIPVVYMTRLDGLAHAHFGVRGMLAADALANGVFGVFLIAWFARGSVVGLGRRRSLER
ncbi:MAG TPA: MFS transporter [Gemmatimonadaceae bacterium]|nr:MFS transporter [Gemmatimonadaceae bacterium]